MSELNIDLAKLEEVSKGLQDYIVASKYARWLPELKRRETWNEAVDRVLKMHLEKYKFLSDEDKEQIKWAFSLVHEKRVLPSMRSLQFGGTAILAKEARGYNCCVRHVDSLRAFSEIAFLMLCGCGTGIGLSKKYLSRLPELVDANSKTGSVVTYVIEDTIEGWADSLEALLQCYFKNNAYSGRKLIFDYSKIRRKGSLLKTSGGRAPGYKPLKAAHTRIKRLLDKIIEHDEVKICRPIHAYDVLMHFADAVLSGGIRRTASSVVFQADDEEMMRAKTYFDVEKYRESLDIETNINYIKVWVDRHVYDVTLDLNNPFDKFTYDSIVNNKRVGWKYVEPQRGRSNNSVLLLRNSTTLEQFNQIIEKSRQFGEPGFVWANNEDTIFNPCFEVGFLPVTTYGECGVQFCNLTSTNGNKIKTEEDFYECVKAQTIIGTLQAGYTDFPYLSKAAKELTEEEALLGDSINGVLSKPNILLSPEILTKGANLAVQVNAEWSNKIRTNKAARITLVKPEGTGSLAIGVNEPGIHAAHHRYFFRRVQATKGEPIYEFFKARNPHMCEKSVWSTNETDDVITFPLKATEGSIIKDDLDAIKHLEIIKSVQKNWVEPGAFNNKKDIGHNVSCTVIVKETEWEKVAKYIFDNREYFAAISLLDYFGDKTYEQAPFEKIVSSEDFIKFNEMIEYYSSIDFTNLDEDKDMTVHMAESSCAGGACEI